MEQQIGQIVKTLQPESRSMVSPLPSAVWQAQTIPLPKTDAECEALAIWAEKAPSSSEAPATFDEIAEALMFLNSVLPSRNFDEEAGEKRTAVFIQILADYSKSQIDYMTSRAARELEWFPVPKQMLDILKEAPKPYNPKAEARLMVHRYQAQKLEDWISSIPGLSVEELNAAPERWKAIAETRMYATRNDDGTYSHRWRKYNYLIDESEAA